MCLCRCDYGGMFKPMCVLSGVVCLWVVWMLECEWTIKLIYVCVYVCGSVSALVDVGVWMIYHINVGGDGEGNVYMGGGRTALYVIDWWVAVDWSMGG